MRKFKLWNHDRTTSFDFNQNDIIITEVSGLGLGYSADVSNGVVANYTNEFDQISLLANFGIHSNAYTSYNNLVKFISERDDKNLVLEYSVNGRTVYADVWLTHLPKSQKTNFNILSERLQFLRTTHWYVPESGQLLKNPSSTIIKNPINTNLEIVIKIPSGISSDFKIIARKGQTQVVRIIPDANAEYSPYHLLIDAETKNVSVIDDSGYVVGNGYNMISKTADTFMVLGKGEYQVYYEGSIPDETQVEISYKKWVVD